MANTVPDTKAAASLNEAADRLIDAGHPLEDDGDVEAALACYREAAAVAPGYPRAHMNIGNALGRLERWDEAITAQRKAVECAPAYAPARFNLGALLAARGDRDGAEQELLEALRLQPAMNEARIILADVYEIEERYEDAEAQFRSALDFSPEYPAALFNFGLFCLKQGRLKEALTWLHRAKTADPALRGPDSPLLFATNFSVELSVDEIAREHFRVGDLLTESAGEQFRAWRNDVSTERRLRVGYVSGDFGPHPIAMFMRPILEQHDRSAFEVFCYSNASQSTSIGQMLRERCDHWREIAHLGDPQAIDQIQRDQIDILVDLSGHTDRERLAIFARHPAPVQVTWLGYLNTTGLRTMDYRITDAHTDPPGETERLHTEELVRLPHSQWCYFAWHDIDPIVAPHPECPNALVFGSFNQSIKITDSCLALWARVLDRVPQAELVVLDVRQKADRHALAARMRNLGIDVSRVTMRGRQSIPDYFRAIGNVDIALDAFPYNGATTTLDALWMGVPIVALRGHRGISRGTYSILRTLGAKDLAADTEDDYVEVNARLAGDSHWRSVLRNTLRLRLAASPLMDAAGFTRDLELRYREMWRRRCRSQSLSA